LPECYEKLTLIRDFQLETVNWTALPPHQQPRKPIKARIGKTYERPKASLPEIEG
jgi:hypothetical protein